MLLLVLLLLLLPIYQEATSVHGGVTLALTGKDCVTLSVDSRFSSGGSTGSLLLVNQQRPVYRVGGRTLVACLGLDADVVQLMSDLRSALSDQIEEDVDPECVSRVISDLLYTSKYICTPIVAGIGENGPYLCTMDGLGALTSSSTFVATGTSAAALLTACEAEYLPNRRPEKILENANRILKSSLQRDVMSGCEIVTYTLCLGGNVYRKTERIPDV